MMRDDDGRRDKEVREKCRPNFKFCVYEIFATLKEIFAKFEKDNFAKCSRKYEMKFFAATIVPMLADSFR